MVNKRVTGGFEGMVKEKSLLRIIWSPIFVFERVEL